MIDLVSVMLTTNLMDCSSLTQLAMASANVSPGLLMQMACECKYETTTGSPTARGSLSAYPMTFCSVKLRP